MFDGDGTANMEGITVRLLLFTPLISGFCSRCWITAGWWQGQQSAAVIVSSTSLCSGGCFEREPIANKSQMSFFNFNLYSNFQFNFAPPTSSSYLLLLLLAVVGPHQPSAVLQKSIIRRRLHLVKVWNTSCSQRHLHPRTSLQTDRTT